MNRREAIKKTGMMLGFAAGSPLLLHVLQGCAPEKTLSWKPLFFNKKQAHLVSEIVDQILPRTDTPGALDVGVDAFVDKMVAEVYTEKEQQQFVRGLDAINTNSKGVNGELFSDLSSERKHEFLFRIESEIKRLDYNADPEQKPFFLMIKELTLLGYFTSEEIMKNHLDYMPVPMKLDGCEPMKENQKLRVGNYF
ncbi:gluconate 2-dehydrogenase subunit 3 family protein [Marivirga sp. S37H4]|uniref:Gluconate 2-dehydrogenase subunit 3 family protein n=1 Tax=Marivirga aurantiaca TaxID=2802615 RepID=A0A934X0W6_9BACT|nr:gluconate 2-dehydrogenase subunit 3 family protein [Marivirga aurantiaca]MBK6266296.1 gluconate 2-dehydrogenase subunit 3 family protein [Marivirga aurantiaca]